MAKPAILIERFLAWPRSAANLAALDRVFFSSSATQSFASDGARAEFRERWFGRYLTTDADLAWLAVDAGGVPVGYVIGSLDDPARSKRFGDIAYLPAFAHLTARYPAHLHVNLLDGFRGQGIGADLVEIFCDVARQRGASGVHVVTSRGMRNVGFYLGLGFHEAGAHDMNGRTLLVLARDLC